MKSKQNKDIFDSLVNNAFDYINKAIDEVENYPKFSLINFYAGIELIFKARLVLEHWTLILDSPKKADFKKFMDGDLTTINLKELSERITNITGNLSKDYVKHFEELRISRNKAMHFFDKDYIELSESTLETIIIQQFKAWHYLLHLLNYDWKECFSSCEEEIESINIKMLGNNKFLETKYVELKAKLEKTKIKDCICQVCGKDIVQENKEMSYEDFIIHAYCPVCNFSSNLLKISCSDCKTDNLLINSLLKNKCKNCNHTYVYKDINDFLKKKADIISLGKAYCSNCKYKKNPTVIELMESKYFCFNCCSYHTILDTCPLCYKTVTGEIDRECVYCNY